MIDSVLFFLSRFSVTFKVGFIILFLITGLLFWNLSYISSNYSAYEKKAAVLVSLEKARAIEELMILLQAERRAALNFLYLDHDAELFERAVENTTKRLATMQGFIQQCRYAKKRAVIEQNLARLVSVRKALLERDIGGIDVVRFYSDRVIKHLGDIIALLTKQNSSDGFMAYFNIINSVEYSALETDLMMAVIGEGVLTEDLFEVIMVMDGKTQSALDSFKRVSDMPAIQKLYATYRNGDFVEINIQKENFRNRLFKHEGDGFDLSSWNRATGKYLQSLQAISDFEYHEISAFLSQEIVRYKQQVNKDLMLLVIPIAIVGMIAYFIFLDINVSLRTMLGFLSGNNAEMSRRSRLMLLKSPSELGQVYRKLFAFRAKINKQIRIIRRGYEYDALTALPNRARLRKALEKALADKKQFTLLYIDIYNFSLVNDSFGQSVGDAYLRETAKVLKDLLHEVGADPLVSMQVYRMGSDEFVIVCSNQEHIAAVTEALTNTYLVKVQEIEMPLTFTFGIAKSTPESTQSSILTQAELAVKDALKQQQRYSVYTGDDSYKVRYQRNLEWVKRIKRAFEEKLFEAYFQPIVSTKEGSCVKYEVLIRLREETGGETISPFEFLPVLQKIGLEKRLTKEMIDQSFAFVQRYGKDVSINMTRDDLDEEMLHYLEKSLQRHKIEASSVSIELVEMEELMQEPYIRVIHKIKALGCKISIDDFGTGYSNFSYLTQLRPDFLKIDGSLIKDINVDVESRNIVKGIVDLARSLDVKLIAEYVSTAEIYAIIQELGIEYAQGYYFGEAMKSDAISVQEGKK